jgi:hypothetical protein
MLKVVLLTIVLGLTSGCQKSDVENCVDAQMEAFDEKTVLNPPKASDNKLTRKEWKVFSYERCLAIAAPKVGS